MRTPSCARRGEERAISSDSEQPHPTPVVHSRPSLEGAVAYRLYRTNRLLSTHLARFLARHRPTITPEKWFVIARVFQHGRILQRDLVDDTLEDAPNVSRLVDALVTAGLLTRKPDPDDRRNRVLQLSPAGQTLAEQLMADVAAERVRLFEGFDATELENLTNALDQLDQNVRRLLDGPTAQPDE